MSVPLDQRELERLEAQMNQLTEEQKALQEQVDNFQPGKDGYTDLQEWNEEIAAVTDKLETVEMKWLELAERA